MKRETGLLQIGNLQQPRYFICAGASGHTVGAIHESPVPISDSGGRIVMRPYSAVSANIQRLSHSSTPRFSIAGQR